MHCDYLKIKEFVMKNLLYSLFLSPLLILLFSCNNENCPVDPLKHLTLEEMYENALKDAAYPTEKDIVNTLTEVKIGNSNLNWLDVNGQKYVLTVILTDFPNSYPLGDTVLTWWGETWVTCYPEIKNFFKNRSFSSDSSALLRIEQLLGLPKKISAKHLIEVYVKLDDLFRPAPDNEIDDNVCQLNFPANVDSNYVVWFNGNIISSYYAPPNKTRYPWTRLGYTYDWGSLTSKVGLSEFIIKKNARVIVKNVKPAVEYIKS